MTSSTEIPARPARRQLDYYMTMASPWAYLGHATLVEAMRRADVAVAVRPTPLGRLFPQTGGLPLPQRHPARQAYRLVDLQRWRAKRNLPLNPHARNGRFDPTLLDGIVIAILATGGDPDPFMRAAFRAIWVEERNLGEPEGLDALLRQEGLGSDLLARAGEPEVAASYDRNLADALAAGVFGAPSYVLDGEVFWGQDRLELLVEAVESCRGPFGPTTA